VKIQTIQFYQGKTRQRYFVAGDKPGLVVLGGLASGHVLLTFVAPPLCMVMTWEKLGVWHGVQTLHFNTVLKQKHMLGCVAAIQQVYVNLGAILEITSTWKSCSKSLVQLQKYTQIVTLFTINVLCRVESISQQVSCQQQQSKTIILP
jgi:hypothetical protein